MSFMILWTDLLVFALLSAGLASEFLQWLRKREPWRGYYALTILAYALTLLMLALTFFNAKYLPRPVVAVSAIVTWAYPLVSVLIAFAYPACVVRVARLDGGWTGGILQWAPPTITAVAIVAAVFLSSIGLSVAVNLGFNGFMAALSAAGAVRVAKGLGRAPKREVLPFLVMGAIAYAAFLALGVLSYAGLLARSDALASPFIDGLFCLAWGVLLVAQAIRRAVPDRAAPGVAVATDFAASIGLSQRESEVMSLLVEGKTNKEIGEALFISTRTVETHVYNAYRECGSRNKAEFVAKAVSFRGAAPAEEA